MTKSPRKVSRAYDARYIRKQEVRLAGRVHRLFLRQLKWVLVEAKSLGFVDEKKNAAPGMVAGFGYSLNTFEKKVNDMLDGMPYVEDVADEVVVSMRAAMLKGGNQIVKDLGLKKLGISFDLKNPRALKIVDAKKHLELSERAGSISKTTRDRIHDILVDAADNGKSYQTVAKEIQEQAIEGVFSKARGRLIATYEIGAAYGEGTNIPIVDFKAKYPTRSAQKRWSTVGGGVANNVRQTHVDNEDDGWVDYIAKHTGTDEDFAPSKVDFNCRCHEQYQIS